MRWRKTLGRSVVDRSSGESIGKLDAFVVDPPTRRITAMVVDGRIATWSDVGGIGPDAVVVPDAAGLRDPASDLEKRIAEDGSGPLGKKVFTEDGFELGSLTDIDLDGETGELRTLLLSDDDLGASRLLGIGSYAVVVSSQDRHPSGGDLRTLSKAELYERARRRDVDGRSAMTKRELIEALSAT